MKIEIVAPSTPSYGPTVWADNRKISAPKKSIADPWGWSEDELIALLGESKFDKYEAGEYEFNISDSHFKLITGQRTAKNNTELKLLNAYGIL